MSDLAEAVIEMGRQALVLGATDRTACWHPDGQQRESVADHTVMLGWVAPALAAKLYPGRLDAALVAEYALIHDMPEVHVGDTPTLRIDDAGRAAKAERENWAVGQIVGTFVGSLPWVVFRLTEYERQVIAEACFVRAVDKILPKIVHLLDGAKGLIEEGMTVAELRGVFERQAEDMAGYAGDFPELLELRAELVERTIALLAEMETTHA